MPLEYRRRKRLGKNTFVNTSKSGMSLSRKMGPVTINSRGHVTIRLGKGLSFRIL